MNQQIIQPYSTEKTSADKNRYVFKVAKRANKIGIKQEIENIYKVKVEKVRILKRIAKQKFFRGKRGKKTGFKKAVIKLKNGHKIEI